MEYLYHGSTTQNITVLEPPRRFTPGKDVEYSAVYATPSPAFATCHSFAWSSSDGIDIDIKNNIVTLIVPSSERFKLNVPVSVYKTDSEHFTKTLDETLGQTFHTLEPKKVLEEMKFSNVEDAMQHFHGSIRFV